MEMSQSLSIKAEKVHCPEEDFWEVYLSTSGRISGPFGQVFFGGAQFTFKSLLVILKVTSCLQ